jgi:hypothetical protein
MGASPAFAKSRATLMALLADMSTQPPPIDLSGLCDRDKIFLLATCCSEMIVEAVWAPTGEPTEALRGLDVLFEDIRDRVRRRV